MNNHYLVIGTGRWAKLYLEALNKQQGNHSRLSLCTSRADVVDFDSTFQKYNFSSIISLETLHDLHLSCPITHIFIVNSTLERKHTLNQIIKLPVSILVEKPILLTSFQQKQLLSLRPRKLHLRFWESMLPLYNPDFSIISRIICDKNLVVSSLFLKWEDPLVETDERSTKNHNLSIPYLSDIYPHLLSILRALNFSSEIDKPKILQMNSSFHNGVIEAKFASLKVKLKVSRHSSRRCRQLTMNFSNGTSLSYNFNTEPGILKFGNLDISESFFESSFRPIEAQIRDFLAPQSKRPLISTNLDLEELISLGFQ